MHKPGRITLSCGWTILLGGDIPSSARGPASWHKGKERTFYWVNTFFTDNHLQTTFLPSGDSASAR